MTASATRAACRLVVVGCSWGGLAALGTVLAALPATVRQPLAVAQHRGTGPSELATLLSRRTCRPVVEVEDKQPLDDGTVFLAPGGYHLLVEPGRLALSTEGPVNHARPSIDVLFESAAAAYGAAVVAVVLTGANHDGARGARAVTDRGGTVLVEDPASATRPEMPAAVLASGVAAVVRPLDHIAPTLAALATGGPL